MSKAKELFEFHKRILKSTRLLPGSETLYLRYIELSEIEEEEFVELILREYDLSQNNEDAMWMLYYIAIYSRGNALYSVYPTLIKYKLFYPKEIYIKAKEAEAKLLMQALENTNSNDLLEIDHILKCLSLIPCDIVKDFFQSVSKDTALKWTEALHVNPNEYTLSGGWIIDNNEIKQLYNDKVTVFKKSKFNEGSLKAPVKDSQEVCPYCNNNLTVIYNDEYELATCLLCTCYQNIITKLDKNGKSHWHNKNEKSDLLDEILQEETEISPFEYALEQSSEKRLSTYTISEYVEITKSQIGGMPTWINDPDYHICPDCGNTMKFVAQIDMEDVEEYGEGLYYFFYCDDCKVVSSSYGQS